MSPRVHGKTAWEVNTKQVFIYSGGTRRAFSKPVWFQVVDLASTAIEGKRWRWGTKEYCAVNNIFNLASWVEIASALGKLEIPSYLRNITTDYKERWEAEMIYYILRSLTRISIRTVALDPNVRWSIKISNRSSMYNHWFCRWKWKILPIS